MRLNNVKDVQKFIEAINGCKEGVFLKSQEGDVFNLKSSLSQYVAIGRLIEESGSDLELFAESKEDEARLLNMLFSLSDDKE